MPIASDAESGQAPVSRRGFFGTAALGLLAPAAAKVSSAFARCEAGDKLSGGAPEWINEPRAADGWPSVSYTYDEFARVVAVVDAKPRRCRTIEYVP